MSLLPTAAASTASSSIRVVARLKPCDVDDETKRTLLVGDDGLSLFYQPITSASSFASPLRSPTRYKVTQETYPLSRSRTHCLTHLLAYPLANTFWHTP